MAGFTEEERCYRAKWGIADEIAGWCVSFHEFRVWTFQETCLANEVVHRGRNIRIRTAAALVMADYWNEYNGIECSLLPIQYLPIYQKRFRLQHLHHQYFLRLQYRCPLPFRKVGEEVSGLGSDEPEWSPNQCLSIIRDQQRASKFEQDAIYGVLGLFPPAVRYAVPVRYDISISTVFVLLVYAMIYSGDVSAFFTNDDHSVAPCNIPNAPSWLPRRRGQFAYRDPEYGPRPRLMSYTEMHVEGRKLVLTGPYLDICECMKSSATDESTSPGNFWLQPLNSNWADDYQKPPEITLTVPLSKHGRSRFPKVYLREPLEVMDQQERLLAFSTLADTRLKIMEAVRMKRLVMVNFARYGEKLLWFVLEIANGNEDEISCDKVWRKVGELETDNISVGIDILSWRREFVVE